MDNTINRVNTSTYELLMGKIFQPVEIDLKDVNQGSIHGIKLTTFGDIPDIVKKVDMPEAGFQNEQKILVYYGSDNRVEYVKVSNATQSILLVDDFDIEIDVNNQVIIHTHPSVLIFNDASDTTETRLSKDRVLARKMAFSSPQSFIVNQLTDRNRLLIIAAKWWKMKMNDEQSEGKVTDSSTYTQMFDLLLKALTGSLNSEQIESFGVEIQKSIHSYMEVGYEGVTAEDIESIGEKLAKRVYVNPGYGTCPSCYEVTYQQGQGFSCYVCGFEEK